MEELAQAALDLGMGAVWEMPVTAFSGSVPKEAGSQTEHAASLIGQGSVLAKTGTAEFGTKDPPQTHVWITAAQGDLAVAIFVEEGSSAPRPSDR